MDKGVNRGPSSIELAEAIEKLIRNPQLRLRIGEDGYQKFKRCYTLAAFEQNFADILLNLMQL